MAKPDLTETFGAQWPRVVATLRADLGDLDLAEDAAAHAFTVAAERWDTEGIPESPGAWLVTVARRWSIDQLRRDQRFADRLPALAERAAVPQRERGLTDDDLLAMIFGCCHRALDEPARIALTLRYVVGLSTADIARSFLIPEATMAKRLVRAKKKIAAAGIPFEVPDPATVGEPLDAVLHVVYLIFTQGHAAPTGELIRGDLCDEARWLAGQLCELVPSEPETWGLAALLAFTDARRDARVDDGEVVLLADQDRSLWDQSAILAGQRMLARALRLRRLGSYQLQAAIAGAHAQAKTFEDTDWHTIRRLYAALSRINPSPVVRLNEAIAASRSGQNEEALLLLETLAAELQDYPYFHAARADMLARAGDLPGALIAFNQAVTVSTNESERRSIQRSSAEWRTRLDG